MDEFDAPYAPRPSAREVLALVEAQRSMMIAVATGGPRIKEVNEEYQRRRAEIRSALSALRLEDPNPYDDLWDWYGKWSSGDLPSYRSRRTYVREFYQPLIEQLTALIDPSQGTPQREPTGWPRVDRGVEKMRVQLARASSEEDFQGVGLLCRETLISLAQAVYVPARHGEVDGTAPSETDARRMLEAYVEVEMAGGSNEEARRHAKASLGLANSLLHRRTAGFRDAALCAEATSSVVNIIAIVSGRRDPS